ncbi:hypothetical protein ACLKA6_005619 [Drosophila palustris]
MNPCLQKGKIPFALAATYTEPPVNRYTYPLELVNWCLMLPVPGLVPASELYSRVMDLPTFLKFQRGVECSNSSAWTYITSAPRVQPFSSLDHILKSNFKIVIWAPEYQKLIKYKQDMQKGRRSSDRRCSPFTFRDDLCMYRGIPVAFPVAINSVFREPLDRLIGEVTATGLMTHWRDMAFSEMITAGKLTLADLGQTNEFRAMQLIDLNYILIAAASMLIFAFMQPFKKE